MNLIHLIKNLDYVCVGSVYEFFFPPYNYNVLINLNKVGTAKKKKISYSILAFSSSRLFGTFFQHWELSIILNEQTPPKP